MSAEDRIRRALTERGDRVQSDPGAWTTIAARRRQARRRRRTQVVGLAATALAIVLVVGALALRGDDQSEEVVAGPDVTAPSRSDTAVVLATVDGDIVRSDLLDPTRHEVLATVDEETTILDLTIDRAGTNVYVSTMTEGDCYPVISRLDGDTLVPLAEGFQAAVAGSTMAYVPTDGAECASLIPPDRGRVRVPVSPSGSLVVHDLESESGRLLTRPPSPSAAAEDRVAAHRPALSSDGARVAYEVSDAGAMVLDLREPAIYFTDGAPLSSDGLIRLRAPVFRDTTVLALGNALGGQGTELGAFDTTSPGQVSRPRLALALPAWNDPARAPDQIDVLGDRLLWLDANTTTGALELWWQGLTDGSAPVLVADGVIDAAFAYPGGAGDTDASTETTVVTSPDSPTDTTTGTTPPPSPPSPELDDPCRPEWATPPAEPSGLVLDANRPIEPGDLVPFRLDIDAAGGQVIWGDEWQLQRASPRPGQATGVLWTAVYDLNRVFSDTPTYGPVEQEHTEDGWTESEGALRLPPDLEPGWYQVIATGGRVPPAGPPGASLAAIATFSIGPC